MWWIQKSHWLSQSILLSELIYTSLFWCFCLHVWGFSHHMMRNKQIWTFCMCQLMFSFFRLQVNKMTLTRWTCKNKPDVFWRIHYCSQQEPSHKFHESSPCLNVVTRIKLGLHTWYASHAPSISVSGPKARRVVWRLEFPSFGGSRQTMTATSALLL